MGRKRSLRILAAAGGRTHRTAQSSSALLCKHLKRAAASRSPNLLEEALLHGGEVGLGIAQQRQAKDRREVLQGLCLRYG